MDTLYRALLRLLPPDFDGVEMWDTYRGRIGEASAAGGWIGALREQASEMLDLVATLAAARWPLPSLDSLREDLRVGLRSLRRAPAFTASSLVILALGIGTAAAVFTAFHAVMLDELPVADADALVSLTFRTADGGAWTPSRAEVDALGGSSRRLQRVAAVRSDLGAAAVPMTEGGRTLVMRMAQVTAGFFEVLGARPRLGRLLRSEDGEEGAPDVAVLSHRAWQREFGGDREVLGRRLLITEIQKSYAIVGVTEPGLDYPVGTDYWILTGGGLEVIGRLAPGATSEAARAESLSIVQALDRQRSTPRSVSRATLRPLSEVVLGDAGPILGAVTVAVALLLLIACVNVGSLTLMHATGRSHDIMVRRALGSTSAGIVRLFLMEGALLGTAGGALGLLCAAGVVRALPALVPAQLPRTEMIELADTPIVAALTVTALTLLMCAVVPAVVAARSGPAWRIRPGLRAGGTTRDRRRVRRTLVATQVALAVVLLFGAGLLGRSLWHLNELELGYDAEDLAILELGLDRAAVGEIDGMFAMLEGVLERVRGVPGVTAATPVWTRPFRGRIEVFATRPVLEEQTEAEADALPPFPVEIGSPELFRAFGIPILRGRGFLSSDRQDARKVAVVSEAVGHALWPGQDPIGKRFRRVFDLTTWWTVVGVAGDTRFRELLEPTPTVYVPWRQLTIPYAPSALAVRIDGDLSSLGPVMRRAVREFDPAIQLWRYGTMRDHLAGGPLAQPRTIAWLIFGFALAAVLLAAIGLYGVMALAVRERTHELGVRTALGATAARLQRHVLREALAIGVTGTVAGLIGALLVSRLLSTLLFDVGPADPLTAVGVCAVLIAVSLIAAYVPAVQATRIDPREALAAD